MNTLEALYSRKSIRDFNQKSILENHLREILKAGYSSPVGRGLYDSLTITVISNKNFLEQWEKVTADYMGEPGLRPFYGAPTVILISTTTPASNVNYSNAAIIVQNMSIAATELGVGACHIWGAVRALNQNSDLINQLGISAELEPCCAIALGYFDGEYQLREIPDNRIKTTYIK